ncbi:hypothetical protein GIB67_018974 [Kingdonia uniflora]|uniref:Uncharacterized protein n=1 Tax=Kingdonia uniflora TaxID=39325 RepID=A0A7J7MGV6_9MAGN|nr:hypothetical protein GIB67_018974 [Kingdonia uniflora]
MFRSLYCEQLEEAEIEKFLKILQKLSKLVRTNAVDSHSGVEVILVCESINERWAAYGSESRITTKDFLEYYAVKYVTATDGAYLSSSSSRPCFFDLSSAGRVWSDNLLWVPGECLQRSDVEPLDLNNRTITKGISCKVSRKESFIDSVGKEGTELEVILKKLGINRFKRVASKNDKVKRSQAKRRMAGKTLSSMKENMLTPELNTHLKLARLNEMPDEPVDMATVSSTVVRNLAKRKAVKRGAASRSATSDSVDDNNKRRKVTPPAKSQAVLEESVKNADGADLRPRFKVENGLMEEQCRAKAREKGVTVVEDEFKKLELEKEREAAALKLKEVRAESVVEAERLVSASATSRNNLAGKLYQLRYKKAEILAFSEGNYEEKEIVDEEEVEEMEDGLNIVEKTIADNQETIDPEIESLRLKVVDLEGLLEVEKKSSADLMFVYVHFALRPKLVSWPVGQGGTGSLELAGVCSASLSVCFCRSISQLEEYEALISQYEDRLDDNVKLSLNPEEAKSQVEDKTATLLSRDLALNQLISELAELKERVTSGSRYDAELAEYRIRALNDEISDMKCNIRALNKQLLKREIDLDIARTNLAVSEANFEKLSSSIVDFRLRDNKRAAITYQSFKEIVVHGKDKCDGEALHQRQLSALVAFFVEEIKFLQVERDLMQGCFFGRTCVCKLNISSIDPIGVMDRGIGTTTAEKIARGRKNIVERSPEYIASRTEIGGSSSAVLPTPAVGGRSTALLSRKSSRIKKK